MDDVKRAPRDTVGAFVVSGDEPKPILLARTGLMIIGKR